MQDLLIRLQTHLERRGLLQKRDRVLLAVSGGPDSVALLHLLGQLRKSLGFQLAAAHFNHRLRGRDSAKDAVFVRREAAKLKIPFYLGQANVRAFARKEKFSTEEAARIKRYEFLNQTAAKKKMNKILTAHTLDDQAETVWMRVLQGTGLRGLCGIRETLKRGTAEYVRPFLKFTKKEILSYLKDNKIPFCKDASNQSADFLRNRIRLKLIPFLEKNFHPRTKETAARIPEILSMESETLEIFEKKISSALFRSPKRGELRASRKLFLRQPAAIQFRILDKALKTLDPKSGLSFDAWQRIQPFLTQKRLRSSLPRDIDFELTPSAVRIYKKLA